MTATATTAREIITAAIARLDEITSYVELLGLAACALADARVAAATEPVDRAAVLDRALNDVLESWATDASMAKFWAGFCAETGLDADA